MRFLGIISELDKSGSVKLPDMLLGLCGIGSGDGLVMHAEGNNVIMKKYPPTCIFCGSEENLQEYRNKSYCSSCANELRNY